MIPSVLHPFFHEFPYFFTFGVFDIIKIAFASDDTRDTLLKTVRFSLQRYRLNDSRRLNFLFFFFSFLFLPR